MIGLLSFHTALNYGARLQCYALQRALELNGHECEYINYENVMRRNSYRMLRLACEALRHGHIKEAVKLICGLPFIAMRRRAFKQFDKKYMKISPVYISSREGMEQSAMSYQKYVVGSDKVWNCVNNGKDTTYLLDFVSDRDRKVSYASSFGMSSVPNDMKEDYKRCLSNIGSLSTRESAGVEIIKELTGLEAKLVLDPVFLLSRQEWERLIPNREKDEKYIFAYLNRKGQYEEFIKKTGFDDSGMKVHLLTRYLKPLDFINRKIRVRYCMSPCAFIENISKAYLVVSASFHCIAFAILLNKPFVAVLVGDKGKDSRVLSLLKALGLEDHILSENIKLNENIFHADTQGMNERISTMRDESLDYLLSAVKG